MSLFIERVFYSCEDIVSTCDSLADPCSIETFDNGIILVFEMIVCLSNPPSMKRFQITQFEGYFNIASCNPIWQLTTLSACHALNLFEINFFADWLMLISHGSTVCFHGVRTYAWATGTYVWLISCVRSHVHPFPFRLDYKTSKSDLS